MYFGEVFYLFCVLNYVFTRQVSLILLRSDGVVYPTEFVYTYTSNIFNHFNPALLPSMQFQTCHLVSKPF